MDHSMLDHNAPAAAGERLKSCLLFPVVAQSPLPAGQDHAHSAGEVSGDVPGQIHEVMCPISLRN